MDWDYIRGNWMQFKGKAREKWGELTDDDLDKIGGKKDQLVGTLYTKYGRAKEEFEHEVDEWAEGLEYGPSYERKAG